VRSGEGATEQSLCVLGDLFSGQHEGTRKWRGGAKRRAALSEEGHRTGVVCIWGRGWFRWRAGRIRRVIVRAGTVCAEVAIVLGRIFSAEARVHVR
jgi:hypothetical protein